LLLCGTIAIAWRTPPKRRKTKDKEFYQSILNIPNPWICWWRAWRLQGKFESWKTVRKRGISKTQGFRDITTVNLLYLRKLMKIYQRIKGNEEKIQKE